MSKTTKEQIIEAMLIAVPYSCHISQIKLADTQLCFTWRHDQFMVFFGDGKIRVVQIDGNTESGSNLAILMESVITRGHLAVLDRQDKAKEKAA